MNLLLVPALVSLVAAGLLVLAVGAGMASQLSRRSAPAGRAILWYSSTALWLAIIFAWVGPFTLAVALRLALGEGGVLLGLWAGGPIGLLIGLVWARRHPGGQYALRGKPVGWWIVGAIALVLLGLGPWLAWQASNEAVPPNRRIDFWLWLAQTVGWK